MIFVIPFLGVVAFGIIPLSYAEDDWKVYRTNVTVDELIPGANSWSINVHESFNIPYKITNGTVQGIKVDAQSQSIIVDVTNVTNHSILEIIVPRDLLDATIPGDGDDKFIILIDGQESNYQQVNSLACFRTISIKIDSNADVEIIATSIPEHPLNSYMPPLYMTVNKPDVDSKVVTVSGCTDLKLDDKQVILKVINTQTEKPKIVSVTPDINGSFSSAVDVEDLGGNGNYTVTAIYAGKSTSETVEVVPEFPTGIIVLLISISFIILISSRTNSNFE